MPRKPGRAASISGLPLETAYTPRHIRSLRYSKDLGDPGSFPYTRGIYPTMYRGRLWTMRQFAGFGSARHTNERLRYLLAHGETGLSIAFDLPTLMGYDSDHELSESEVGKLGVAIDSLEDMETLFRGIPLGKVSVSMTINGPACILLAMYIAAAAKQGVPARRLRGTIQNDILKEYIAQKEWLFPPKPSLRIVADMIDYSIRAMPKYNPISISGYHIREAGSTAAQELAFTLADGFTYVEECLARGMAIDRFAPHLSFFFNSHIDFLEEIAKYRAARRIWARRMRERYGAKQARSWMLRFHTQTAGVSLTDKQPELNIVRVAYEALAAVLGGTQSLHTNSMDETICIPTEKAVRVALRTQQILAHEIGVANTADPLGGSYCVEALTDRMEREAENYFRKIESLGGMVGAIEKGFPMKEIANASYRYQNELQRKERIIVGVNDFVLKDEKIDIPIFHAPKSEPERRRALKRLRSRRSRARWQRSLDGVRRACETKANLMPPLLEAVRAEATLGEIADTMRSVFGTYHPPEFL